MIHQTAVKGRQLSVVACTLALSVAIPWPKASAEATNTTPSKTPPSYIEADRSDADQVLGSALTDNVFSDRFTALRKQLVATSLRGNPAPGCAEPPVFTLEVVSPEKPTSEGSAWEETYAISCKERVRRTFLLFLSVREGMKHSELAPGDTLADAILQRDFLQSATAAAISRARAGCRGTQVRNTRDVGDGRIAAVDRSLEHGRVRHLGRHQRHVLAIAKGRDRLVHRSTALAPSLTATTTGGTGLTSMAMAAALGINSCKNSTRF